MKRISKLILITIILLFALFPTVKSVAKEAPFYFSEKTKKNYHQEESILIAKNTNFKNFYASEVYKNVKEVQFEEGITELDQYIFFYFPNVEKITLPSTIENIMQAFDSSEKFSYDPNQKHYALRNLKTIEVNPENPLYTSIEDGLYTKDESELICYPAAKESFVYQMPSLVTRIDDNAFGHNTNLREIVFGTQFDGKYGINMESYGDLPNVTTYRVDESNCYLSVVDGVLYNYDQTLMLSVPYGKEIEKLVLLDTVTDLGYRCFVHAEIDELVLPANLNLNPSADYAFEGNQIASISAKDNNFISTVDGVLYDKEEKTLICWPERKKVDELKFPSTLETIPISIPHIEDIKHLIIPRDCAHINLNLKDDSSLETIEVETGNNSYKVQDGILYSRSEKIMYLIAGKSKVTTVTIPKNYTYCYLDYDVTMPSVTKLIVNGTAKDFPYYLFPNVKEIVVGAGNKKLKVKDQVLFTADMKTLLYYPASKTNKSFTVPSSVTRMSDRAFYGQKPLQTLTLPKNLAIGEDDHVNYWFQKCTSLNSIKVVAGNSQLCSVDGVLYNKKKTELICYPAAKTTKSFKVPDSVVIFRVSDGNPYLTSLTLGAKLNVLLYEGDYEDWYMKNFTKLSKISISKKNKSYVVQDNVLYEKVGSYLVLEVYPVMKKNTSYTFGKNVSFGFSDWTNYTKLRTIKSLNPYVVIFDKNVCDYTYSD